MTVPKACQPLKDELDHAYVVLKDIQSAPGYLDHGKPTPGGLEEAEAQEAKIAQLQRELDDCKRAHGVAPAAILTFSGRATLHSEKGSGHHDFSIPLSFDDGHKHFNVQEFDPIGVTVKETHPDGSVETHHVTITQTGGGAGHYNPENGHVDLQIDLLVDAAWPGGHMNFDITLSTDGAGTPITPSGELTLVGRTEAHGSGIGFPGHIAVTLTAKGKIHPSPHP